MQAIDLIKAGESILIDLKQDIENKSLNEADQIALEAALLDVMNSLQTGCLKLAKSDLNIVGPQPNFSQSEINTLQGKIQAAIG